MKIRERQTSHMIDFLFPLALFFCFAVSAIVLILMATGIYRSTTESSARNHVGRTALAYVSEKSLSGRWERNQRLSCGGRATVGLTARTSMNMRARSGSCS